MTATDSEKSNSFDRTNAYVAAFVFLVSFIVYAMTVQRSLPFWDCGELIACAVIGGIPHPPGFPLLVLISHIFSKIPFVEDVSYRVNYVSVISSAFTALFSYLITVRLVRYIQGEQAAETLNRFVAYASGAAGGFFVAFSSTNWGNSVEAETYALSLALSTAIFWLALRYHERRDQPGASKIMILAMYLAVLGIGVHMTVFLVVPVCAIFFILNRDAGPREFLMICLFALIELLLVIVFSGGRGGPTVFKFMSVILGIILLVMLYRRIRWGVLIAIGITSSLMISFSLYFWALPIGVLLLVGLGVLSQTQGWNFQWRSALAVLVIGFIGFSVHFWVPIRSGLNPRIDENNASRDWHTFVNFLDRKQYGQVSMVDRMFTRRGDWTNQFGRHPNMGFWSYFETQYGGPGRWGFAPLFILGLLGAIVAIRKRLEVGMPFFTLLILASVGLILYMNFADGTRYNPATEDAYLEVRNRDYFFTPAFVFFGIAMGAGIAAVVSILRRFLANSAYERPIAYAGSLLALLPLIPLSDNYHPNDRSRNFLAMNYAKGLLDGCRENAILFTVGDNDTFPIWCLQEAYNYRKDIRVVNLSLLNTDWYAAQMKNQYGVPISLTDEQILWHPYELPGGIQTSRPLKSFADRPRRRMSYLHQQFSGIPVQDMMVDEIVIENKWQYPIYFSAPPYADSPLKLREHAVHDGQLFRLERDPDPLMVDLDHGYELYTKVYSFEGLENSVVFRDDNATGVFGGLGMASLRIVDELYRQGDTARAEEILNRFIRDFPEFWQPYTTLAEVALQMRDTARALALYRQLHDTLVAFLATNPRNQYYLQDLGTAKYELGRIRKDTALQEDGVRLLREGWAIDMNSGLAFRKLITVLGQSDLRGEVIEVARQYANYKRNRTDPLVQSLLGITGP
ncbi:MAG: DUF2723 domain-containing protein [Candidatus Zixiibacteriota bacterium]